MVQLLYPYMTTGKNIALTRWIFVGKVMSLLCNMLSRLVIVFFSKEQGSFNFMAAVTTCSDFGIPKNKVCHCFLCFSIYWHEVMGLHAMIIVFWMLSFKPTFSLSSFTFIKRLFSSLLSAVRMVSYAYKVIDISPGNLDSCFCFMQPDICMMYSTYKLNKQGDNIQPWYTPFPIWNQSVVPCSILTAASWPAYRCLKRQVRWSGIPISFRIFHSLLWSTQSKALV